jgi:raffinose synthase
MTRRSPICPWLRGVPAKSALTPATLGAEEFPGLAGAEGCFLRVPASKLASARLRPASLVRYLALCRHNRWWLRPAFGGAGDAFPSPASLVLWERDSRDYGLLLPLMTHTLRPSLGGGGGAIEVLAEGGVVANEGPILLLTAQGPDPLALIDGAFAAADRVQSSFRGRLAKPTPAWVDLLGWNTWDAFYRRVDAARLRGGLESWRELGFVPPRLGLDDGWQQHREERLTSFSADGERFPGGLGELTREVREGYGVRHVTAWLALTGYWAGVDPAGPLGTRYRLTHHRTTGVLPWALDEEREVSLIHPSDAHRFFDDWVESLRRQGVDGLKVDNQASLWELLPPTVDRADGCRSYQRGLQAAVGLGLHGEQLSCMGQSLEVVSHALGPQVVRNSEDYFPDGDAQRHVLDNAYNALWTAAFGLPDWDMFQSHDPAAAFHAAARAVSGGPITLSDRPGQQDIGLVRGLCTSDGRVLRFDHPARPTVDRLLCDCSREPLLLKLTNRAGSRGVIGLFHCRGADGANPELREPIEDRFRVADVPRLAGRRFAVYLQRSRELRLLDRRNVWRLELPWRGFEIATLAPLSRDVAALGLLDKLAGAAAVLEADWKDPCTYEARFADGGQMGFYWGLAPAQISLNGVKLGDNAPAPNPDGLLVIDAPRGGPTTVRFTL